MLYPTELRARSGADPPAKGDGVLHPQNTTTRPRCAGPLGRFTAALISVSASSTAFTSRTRSGIFITTSLAWLGRHVLPGTPARYTRRFGPAFTPAAERAAGPDITLRSSRRPAPCRRDTGSSSPSACSPGSRSCSRGPPATGRGPAPRGADRSSRPPRRRDRRAPGPFAAAERWVLHLDEALADAVQVALPHAAQQHPEVGVGAE